MEATTDRDVRRSASQGRTGRADRLPVDDAFDATFAGELARLESYNKHHYRPNTYVHKWWARRCGSTFRLILKHLVQDEARRDYYAAGGLEGKVVLDPMMGGGTTLHEAIRMGASVVGIDVDPIPVMQARASLAQAPLQALERDFGQFYKGIDSALREYWLTRCPQCDNEEPLRFVLYGARRRCACGPAIAVDSFVLRYENQNSAIRLCPRCHAVVNEGHDCECQNGGQQGKLPLVEKQQAACERCGVVYREETETPFYARYAPLAVAGQCSQHGLFFRTPSAEDVARIAAADAQRDAVIEALGEGFSVAAGPKARDLLNHGVSDYRDLFSGRQLLYLQQSRALLTEFEAPIRLKLALLVSTSLEFNSMLCGYKGGPQTARGARPGAIRHAFSYHGYSFPYTALENNMLFPAKASGTLQKLFHDRLWRAQRWARAPRERRLSGEGPRFVPVHGERDMGTEVRTAAELAGKNRAFLVRQGTAAELPLPDDSVDFVVTDPPYYDNVQYSDLAAFFRVWLPRLVSERQEEAYAWRYDLSQVAVDSLENGNGQYGRVLGQIFGECRRVLKEEGRLIFTFHHWKPESWAALTLALQQARFRLVNRYIVHSENPISVHVANLRSLTDDAILVLAPVDAGVHRTWQRPATIEQSRSDRFCRDCATLLGWMLEQEMGAGEVGQVWRVALRATVGG
ncbi:MAG: hypothetical protein ACOC9Z_06710 [Chloroflexota bacterium]